MSLLTAFVSTSLAVLYVAAFILAAISGLKLCEKGRGIIGFTFVILAITAILAPIVYHIGS